MSLSFRLRVPDAQIIGPPSSGFLTQIKGAAPPPD